MKNKKFMLQKYKDAEEHVIHFMKATDRECLASFHWCILKYGIRILVEIADEHRLFVMWRFSTNHIPFRLRCVLLLV